jgi:hypothetical protein
MYMEKEYRERCVARGLKASAIEAAVAAVEALEAEAKGADGTLRSSSLASVERHVAGLVAAGTSDEERLLALGRYFQVLSAVPGGAVAGADAGATGTPSHAQAITIRLLAYLLPVGVLPAMADRLASLEGESARARVMSVVRVPPCGAPPEDYPAATAAFVSALERELGSAGARRLLAWNVHGIPASAFIEERERFLAAPSIQAWLDDYHERQVAVLERHAADGTLWFEQRITPRVVESVRKNREVLGGLVEGGTIYMTKIPYDPDAFLASDDPIERRRRACHCPLARSTISSGGAGVPSVWCSCSAGYEKFFLDVVFGEDTKAEVVESVLAGDGRCRFAIAIPPATLAAKRAVSSPGS